MRRSHDDALGLEDRRDAGREVGVVVDDQHAHLLVAPEREHLLDGGSEPVGLDGLGQVEGRPGVRGRDAALDVAPLGEERHGDPLETRESPAARARRRPQRGRASRR